MKAVVLAAGFGTRLGGLTAETPKPLLDLGGTTLLDCVVDHLVACGITEIAVNLLRGVQPDQRWGVSAAFTDSESTVAVKDGWYPDDDDDWRVNSAGFSYIGTNPVALAVLTEHQPSFEAGVTVVNNVSARVGEAAASSAFR